MSHTEEKTPEADTQESSAEALRGQIRELETKLRLQRNYTAILTILIGIGSIVWVDRYRFLLGLIHSILQAL